MLLRRAGKLRLSQLVRKDLNVEKMSVFSLIPEKVDGVITLDGGIVFTVAVTGSGNQSV